MTDTIDFNIILQSQVKAQTEEIYWFFEIIEREKLYERYAREGSIGKDFYFITFPEPYLGMMDVFFVPKPAKKSIDLATRSEFLHAQNFIDTSNREGCDRLAKAIKPNDP